MTSTGHGPARRLCFLLIVATTVGCVGCRQRATVHIIKLGRGNISTEQPLLVETHPTKGYYWINAEEKLCVALGLHRESLLGKAHERDFAISLVLGEPPAGAARNYRVHRNTLRFRDDAGLVHLRGRSLRGIATVWDFDKQTLKGRFRIEVLRQSYFVLTGWRNDAHVLFVGEFEAIHDARRGAAMLARTEENDMARTGGDGLPKPVTGPPRKGRTRRKGGTSFAQPPG